MISKSESIAALAAALSAAQSELKPAPFNQVNKFLGNEYADLGSVIETCQPILAKNNLALSQFVTGSSGEIGITSVIMHKSGEWISSTITLPMADEKGKSMAQVAGSIISYLRRYGLASILNMYAEKDDDGATAGKKTSSGNGYQDLDEKAKKDPATAFWTLQKHIGISKADADAIVEECNKDMKSAYKALRNQAPPESA